MPNTKLAYASSTNLTITANSLAANSARQSTVVNNDTDGYVDAFIAGTVITVAGTLADDARVELFAYGSANGGTNYTDGATGSDAAFTAANIKNMVFVGIVPVRAANVSIDFGPMSIASAFGGLLPQRWGLVLLNKTGLALAGSGNAAWYQGVNPST